MMSVSGHAVLVEPLKMSLRTDALYLAERRDPLDERLKLVRQRRNGFVGGGAVAPAMSLASNRAHASHQGGDPGWGPRWGPRLGT
jgi:hypothetical protein